MKNTFGKNIAAMRHKNGWSQKDTAAKLGISQALLSHYEKGIRECGLEFLVTAANVFNCSVDSLLGLAEPVLEQKIDADNISADLKMYSDFSKGREDAVNTLSLLYSITARIGNPEICKDFNNIVQSEIFLLARVAQDKFFSKENFKEDMVSSLATANLVKAKSLAAINRTMVEENINVNLTKERVKEEYPVTSRSFYKLISYFEK